jgi:hypothetical protein
MLNRQVGGLFGFTTDIGGYFDQFGAQKVDAEIFSRWTQWSALTPYFRLHNSSGDGTKMPWDFDDATLANWRKHSDLHRAAQPLIHELWRDAVRTGAPIVRPLWLAFPGDADAAKQDQEWMLGEDVLVAPVVEKGAVKRDVYFPAGEWVHPETQERFRGPASREVAAPLGRLPYFFRAGTDPFHAAAARAGETLGLRSARRCVSRRRFEIRIRRWRGQRIRSARVWVDGKRVRVRRSGGRLRATVVLRGKRRGTYRVRIVAVTRSGRKVRATRTYRTCRPKRR